MRPAITPAALGLAALFPASVALAQCIPEWLPTDAYAGVNGVLHYSFVPWDPDGPGPRGREFIAYGNFTMIECTPANQIAAWDPATDRWAPLSLGITSRNGGYASVESALVAPNGDLVVGGRFDRAGAVSANSIARWSIAAGAWTSPFGTGIPAGSSIFALAILPNGDIIAGGDFSSIGGVPVVRIARWNGAAWSPMGQGLNGAVRGLAVTHAGDVVACGDFSASGAVSLGRFARWINGAWTPMGEGTFDGILRTISVLPDGDLLACGSFTSASGVPARGLARWHDDGAEGVWSEFGGVAGPSDAQAVTSSVLANGDLLVGGSFTSIGGVAASSIARWDGSVWTPVGEGLTHASAIAELADGQLLVYGGSSELTRLVRWDGASWRPARQGVALYQSAFAVASDGALLSAGEDGRVLRCDAATGAWTLAAPGFDNRLSTLSILHDGSLIAGGVFSRSHDQPLNRIARLVGDAWSPLDVGIGSGDGVFASAVLPNGDLAVGGSFIAAGGVPARYVARWDGARWSSIGPGMNGEVYALTVLPNGDLIAGGDFSLAGGRRANFIARWNGRVWAPIASGTEGFVTALAVLPNGDLLAGGQFYHSGSPSYGASRWDGAAWHPIPWGTGDAAGLAILPGGDLITVGSASTLVHRWNGAAWSNLGAGLRGTFAYAAAAAVRPNGDLVVGGSFTYADGVPSPYLARYRSGPIRPLSASAEPGASAWFSALADQHGPATYQWRRRQGSAWTPLADEPGRISGAAGPILTLSNVSAADVGSYDCLTSNSCSADPIATTPTSFTLAACADALVNRGFDDASLRGWTSTGPAPIIRTDPGVPFALSAACVELPAGSELRQAIAPVPFAGLTARARRAAAGQPAWLDLSAVDAQGRVARSTFELADDWREYGLDLSGISFAQDFAPVAIALSGADPSGAASRLLVDAVSLKSDEPAAFLAQPDDAVTCAHHPVTLRVLLREGPAFSIQWLRNGVPIVGADAQTLTIADPTSADAGRYTCTVTGPCGELASRGAILGVNRGGDFNGDSFTDFFDYDGFLAVFEAAGPDADYNGDGFIDFTDYDDFVAAFESGC